MSTESNILPFSVPLAQADQCGVVYQNEDDCDVKDKNPSIDLKIEYPASASVIPFAGGSVISFPYRNADFRSLGASRVRKVIGQELEPLNNFDPTGNIFDILTRMRVTINRVIRDIGKRSALRRKVNLPQIFISTFQGDDSDFVNKTDQAIASVFKVCEIEYVPIEAFDEITERLLSIEELKDIVGVSGETLGDLGGADVYKQVLELFPIFNISESDIVRRGLGSVSGGFYTFDETTETIYLKFPDLSGKDSFAFAPDIFEERNFYLEIFPKGTINRIKLDYSVPPSISFAGGEDFPSDFPENDSLTFTIESNKEISNAYLSVITDGNVDGIRGLNVTNDAFELYTAPLLTQPVIPNTAPTFSILDNLGREYVDLTNDRISGIFTSTAFSSNIERIGLASDLSIVTEDFAFSPSSNTFFGEKNRPEVLFLDTSRRKPRRRNDRQYNSAKITQARQLFSNIRPKIYTDNQIPELWLKTSNISDVGDGNYEITFPTSELNIIEKDNLDEIRFVLYVRDEDGQMARAPGVITLSLEKPFLSSAEPSGFIGSREISPSENIRITLRGENLRDTARLRVTTVDGVLVNTFEEGANADATVIVGQTSVSLSTFQPATALGFAPSSRYLVVAETGLGKTSNPLRIYVSDGDGGQAEAEADLADLSDSSEFSFAANGSATLDRSIPVVPTQNSSIKLKSASKYFSGDVELFAYLAVDSANKNSLLKVDFESELLDLNGIQTPGGTTSLSVARNINYELSKSPAGSDFFRLSNKRAELKLPGDKYSGVNFSSFTRVNHPFYIIFTNRNIETIDSAINAGTLEEQDYFVLQLGTNNEPAFSNPPQIVGLAAVLPEGAAFSTIPMSSNDFESVRTELGKDSFISDQGISTFKKLSKLAVIFYGDGDENINKRINFFIGNNRINNRLSQKIEPLLDGDPRYVAYFENIKIKEQGDLSVYIEKKNKDFGVTSSTDSVTRTGTFILKEGDFSYNSNEGILTVNTNINNVTAIGDFSGLITSGLILDQTKLYEIIPPGGSGISLTTTQEAINFTNSVNLSTNFDIRLSSEGSNIDVFRGSSESDISSLDLDKVELREGTTIFSSSFLVDDTTSPTQALAFLNLEVGNANLISFNKPEITSLVLGTNSQTINTNIDSVQWVGGETYTIRVKSSEKNFVLLFNENIVVRPKNVKATGIDNEWEAIIIAPKTLIGQNCPEVCGSITNAERNEAKLQLGTNFVVDIQKKMFGLVDGINKVKIPDYNNLKELIEDFPLRFASLKLDKVSIPTDLINSFCDMSFHLTADLQIALKGFQILMVPIQIIFCIIDVICALLNPVKVAKAVIRLFLCLYDLILLLPQISVPVMFIQLILHLLRLLECVLEKVIRIVIVINEVIQAIELAKDGEVWDALKSLEETLSEYLLDLNVSLSVLDPIVSILAIFLQLLGLAFRFPCTITDEQDEFFCMDGSMLGGLILSRAIDENENFNFNNLLPVAQSYSEFTIEEAVQNGSSDPLIDPSDGNLVARQDENSSYLDSMNVDPNSLKSTFAGNPTASGQFNVTFAASATKSRKGFGKPNVVSFLFREKGRNGFFNQKKIIDPDQTLDGPIFLLNDSNNQLRVETGNGKNFVSPIDAQKFINVNGDVGNVRPLVLTFDVPITELNEETGEVETVGVETVTRTFDNIPRIALLDEELNVYFIEEDGIEFRDGAIESIRAKIINRPTASKIRFLREDEEIDTDDDGEADDEAPVFDFPQIHFFDMRAVAEDIETKCGFDFFNNDLLDDDPDDIADVVEEGADCLDDYIVYINNLINTIRESMIAGEVPNLIDVDEVTRKGQELEDCLEGTVDKICIYVVNSLNSQFKVLEDDDETPLSDFPESGISEELSGDFEIEGPTLTGAREYAAGIGDSATIPLREEATIQITPRDSYDNPVPGDLSSKIILEIVSDTTQNAQFVRTNDQILVKDGDDYFAKVTSNRPGIVKLRAKICNKTIQAVTFANVDTEDEFEVEAEVDCVPDGVIEGEVEETALGALTKIDRIITLFFSNTSTIALGGSGGDEEGEVAKARPQAFGSELEN